MHLPTAVDDTFQDAREIDKTAYTATVYLLSSETDRKCSLVKGGTNTTAEPDDTGGDTNTTASVSVPGCHPLFYPRGRVIRLLR